MAVLTNLALNPQPKLSDVGWSRSGGTSTWGAVSTGFDGTTDAYMSLEFTVVPGTVVGEVTYTHELADEALLSAAVQVMSSRAQVFTPLVTFFDATDTVLEVFYGPDVAAAASTAVVCDVSGMDVPAGATYMTVTVAVSLDDGTPPEVGDVIFASRAIVTQSLQVRDYFDGSYPNAGWNGDAWESTSQMASATAPVLVALPDFSPVPRVSVLFPQLHPFASRITVQRVVQGRVYSVRGAVNAFVFGGYGVLDMEAPKSVVSTYRAAQYDAAGVFLEYTDSASITLNFEGSAVHQPLDPNRNVRYNFLQGAVADIVRPTVGETFYPQGRILPVWVGSGTRRGIQSVNLDGYTLTLEDAESIESIFGGVDDPQMPILCVRTADMDLPPTFFALVEEPHRLGFDRQFGGETIMWGMVGTEVQPPAEGLVVPLLTYDDLDVSYATYDLRDAAYATYLEQDTDWELAGAASA